MNTVREDVYKLLNPVAQEIYRVRKSWTDVASQKGAYYSLETAKKCCDNAGEGYEVYNNKGVVVYRKKVAVPAPAIIMVGDVIKLKAGAKYTNGKTIPNWVINSKLYLREVQGNNVVFSTQKTGAITGSVSKAYIQGSFTLGYKVKITSNLNVRKSYTSLSKKVKTLAKNSYAYIVAEKGSWGKLQDGSGWISLKYTKKV